MDRRHAEKVGIVYLVGYGRERGEGKKWGEQKLPPLEGEGLGEGGACLLKGQGTQVTDQASRLQHYVVLLTLLIKFKRQILCSLARCGQRNTPSNTH